MQLPSGWVCGMIVYMLKHRGRQITDIAIVLIMLIKSDDVRLLCIGGMVLLVPVSEEVKRWCLIAAMFAQWIVELQR